MSSGKNLSDHVTNYGQLVIKFNVYGTCEVKHLAGFPGAISPHVSGSGVETADV